MLLLIKDCVTAVGYLPPVKKSYQAYETERVWSLITGGGEKLAIGFAYLCATSDKDHLAKNKAMYQMLQEDMAQLKSEGFGILMMGDFNSHVGPYSESNPMGILGDTCPRNGNGTLFVEFLERNDMVIANKFDVCQGTFTRVEAGRCSVLDFGIIEEHKSHLIASLVIDEEQKVGQGSDHSFMEMVLRLDNGVI